MSKYFKKINNDSWTIYIMKKWLGHIDPAALMEKASHPEAILRDDKRSYVAMVEFQGHKLVDKIPREKDQRCWMRVVSILRQSEVKRLAGNMLALTEDGFLTSEPVLYMEKRQLGMVISSRIFYQYLEGEALQKQDYVKWLRTLDLMHRLGWVHRDPHVDNFVVSAGRIGLIDSSRARLWRNPFHQMYDFVLAENSVAGIIDFYAPQMKRKIFFRLARSHNNLIKGQRRAKQVLRNILKIERRFL